MAALKRSVTAAAALLLAGVMLLAVPQAAVASAEGGHSAAAEAAAITWEATPRLRKLLATDVGIVEAEKLLDTLLKMEPVTYQALAPIPPPDAQKAVARSFKSGSGSVLFSGTGLFAATLSPDCTHVQRSDQGAMSSFYRFTALLARLAVQRYGADPRLEVWVQLSINCYIPVGMTTRALDRNLASRGLTNYTLADLPAVQNVSRSLWPELTNSPTCWVRPLAENAASLIEQALKAAQAKTGLPGLQVKMQQLVELYLQMAQVNMSAPLVQPYRDVAKYAKGVLTSDYDSAVEKVLNRTGLDYVEILNAQGAKNTKNPAATFFNSPLSPQYAVHVHGFHYNKGTLVYSLGSYDKTAASTIDFLTQVASTYNILFVGTAGGLLDAHFLQAWLRLMKAGSKRTHYVLLVEREIGNFQSNLRTLGPLGAYMSSVIQIIQYAPGSDYGQLPVFFSGLAEELAK